jgi:hypothetical protein
MDWATEPRHAAVRQILQQHMDAGAPCTQLAAVQPSGSLGPSTEPQPQGSAAGAAGQTRKGPGSGARRAFRFKCHSPDCPHSEASLQRLFLKCSRCRSARYCSPECKHIDWKAHKPSCRAPTLEGDMGPASPAKQTRRTAGAGAGASGCGDEQPVEPHPPSSEAAAADLSGAPGPAGEGGAGRVCAWAGCSERGRQKCSRCDKTRYCGAAHQKLDWGRHKLVCRAAVSAEDVQG